MRHIQSGNAHDRRKAKRAIITKARKASADAGLTVLPRLPMGVRVGDRGGMSAALETKSDELQPGSFAIAKGSEKPVRDSVQDEAKNLRADYVFVPGSSVRNNRTGSIATALARRPLGMILVHRRDNRKVEWPVSECENWNL